MAATKKLVDDVSGLGKKQVLDPAARTFGFSTWPRSEALVVGERLHFAVTAGCKGAEAWNILRCAGKVTAVVFVECQTESWNPFG